MIQNYRFTILMVSILLLLLIYPFFHYFELTGLSIILNIFTTLILISSINAVSDDRRHLIIGAIIIIPAILFGWSTPFAKSEAIKVMATILQVLAFGIVAYYLLGYALRSERIDYQKIAAAVSVYLLLGVLWHDLYELINVLIPGSFNSDVLTSSDFLYYSFITLSTLGYGDITPVNGPAQALAYMEALIGQLYLTILVARLVGLHIAYTGPDGGKDK